MPARLSVRKPSDFVPFEAEAIHQGIHQRFEAQVRLHPLAVALRSREATYTYSEINASANALAEDVLRKRGDALGQAAILLPNSVETVVGMLGLLKAHKAYVPLDYRFPVQRLREMLNHSEATLLVTDDQRLGLADQLCEGRLPILNLSQIHNCADAPNPNVPCDPLERAYILYTSGSTGKPKGIAFLHRNLLHTTMCLTNKLFFAPSDKVTWLHSASFAASVVDIYCCLCNGAALYPWEVRRQGFGGLAEWLEAEKVTTFQWIPSAFRQFLRTVSHDFVFESMRLVVMASEPLTIREVEAFRRHFPGGSHLVNQVGTSESYNYRLYAVDHAIAIDGANVPGGYAVSADRQVVILDDQRRVLPAGSVGEIGVKSDYMSAGYWRDEALSSSKYVLMPGDSTPVFLTGDLGKLEPDGCLIHLGRKDFQVKVRGYRVELAEIETVLAAAPGVSDCVAWVFKNRLGENQLIGYLVGVGAKLDLEEIEKYVRARLPDYMVPSRFVVVKAFPTLPTGKVDRSGLPDPFEGVESAAPSPGDSSRNVIEGEIIALFRELLQSRDVGPNSHFMKAGGDSLLASILTCRIQQRFKIELMLEDFEHSPTPAHLADMLKAALDAGEARVRCLTPHVEPGESGAGDAASGSGLETVRFTRGIDVAHSGKENLPLGQKKKLIIIGAGQFGRETLTWAIQAVAAGLPLEIKGFLDDNEHALDGFDYQVRVLGNVENYKIEKDDVFVGAIGSPRVKMKCYSPIAARGGRFINLIHPLSNIGNNVELGSGIVLGPFASITCDVKIGHHVTIGAFTNTGHDTIIGDWSQISSHCGINGGATLGRGVFLGSHACVVPKAHVGAWAFVGAGSVVVRDIPPGVKVFGAPASVIGRT